MYLVQNNSIDKTLSGNRRHIFLFCNNVDIKNFRDFTIDVIEKSLVLFYESISNFSGIIGANNWLYGLQEILLSLQENNTSRINKERTESAARIINYLPIKG